MRFAKIKILALFALLLFPVIANAQTSGEIFKAEVIEVLQEKTLTREDGSTNIQQNLKLKGLDGGWKGKKINFIGISEIDAINSDRYKEGEIIFLSHNIDADGNDVFYPAGYVRYYKIYWLVLLFILFTILIGRFKGFRALISLAVSFLVIIYFILPQIINGKNPMLIGVIGAFIILIAIIYLTEGVNKKSNLAIISILISLFLTAFLAEASIYIARLTGMAQEEILFLVDFGKGAIDFRGLLLAGILIGTLGALDDVVISQIEAVTQLKIANSKLSKTKLFKMAFEIGNTHMGAMINTLFLAYAGAALPLLLLFSVHQEPFISFHQIINNEMIAVEIIRTLVGSIGLILAMPLATFMAVHFIDNKKEA
ncbi:MAG: YibE/F family protein [Patescibacteria group bacterium]